MLLEAKNIRKAFDGQDVLKGVDLQVDKGFADVFCFQ